MKKRLGRRIGVTLLSIALLAQEISLPAWASESVSGTNDTALVEIVDLEGDILTDVSDGNPVLEETEYADNQTEDTGDDMVIAGENEQVFTVEKISVLHWRKDRFYR